MAANCLLMPAVAYKERLEGTGARGNQCSSKTRSGSADDIELASQVEVLRSKPCYVYFAGYKGQIIRLKPVQSRAAFVATWFTMRSEHPLIRLAR